MKVRQGFVSNSSSSSFLVIGKKVNTKDVTLEDFKSKHYFIDTYRGYDGPIHINTRWFAKDELERLYNFLQDKPEEDDGINHDDMIEIFKYDSDSGEFHLDLKDLPVEMMDNLLVSYGECDQHSPTDMDGIEQLLDYGEY